MALIRHQEEEKQIGIFAAGEGGVGSGAQRNLFVANQIRVQQTGAFTCQDLAQDVEYMTKGLVVVLGRAGRNFAAGMSGGVAFVLDETGEFSSVLCNQASVDLEPVVDSADMQALLNLITRHVEATGSPRGKWILENWGEMLPKFVKVFPHEYKRVLGIPKYQAGKAEAAHSHASQGATLKQEAAHG